MSNGTVWVGVVSAIALLFILLEGILRSLFGFGNPLTYMADPQIGYLLTPNQNTRRFGNQIVINAYSMRSSEISAVRPNQTLRILLLGDSIVNGGWWTDQNQTISALLQQQLQGQVGHFKQVEVLNASANSWSPRNQLAYLQRFGTFGAQMVVQVINTDDLFGIAPSSLVVGRDLNYPERRPVSAISEVFSRYFSKPQPIPELEQLWQEGGDRVGANLAAIEQVKAVAMQHNAQLLLAITPLLREIGEPGPRDYEKTARQRLQDFTQQQQIPLIDFLPLFNLNPLNTAPFDTAKLNAANAAKTLYRDSIHLNQAGNLQVVERLREKIEERINDESSNITMNDER
ncbi:MAG: SGNH/GDSL hydrolase family protein [Leptolyngbyaceae cyanobacterium CRU_2_3]|nr:SGNH/GDSL hydrolase family protein [Leptolyngbyaceae cyanobacterium CRU_2_3]